MKQRSVDRRVFFLAILTVLVATVTSACAPAASLGACPPNCPYTLSNSNALVPASTEAAQIKALFNFILILATVIFVIVEGMLLFSILRFRGRPPESAVQVHGNTKLEVAWTAAPAVILAVLLGFTLRTMGQVKAVPSGNVLRVTAIGHQWWWEFRYPDLNIVTANELVVPLGSTVEVSVESVDVEHGFWAPELFGKVDAVPGRVNRVRFTPTEIRSDYYGGQCTQFCGLQHSMMRFAVAVKSAADFQTWAANEQHPAAAATGEAVAGEKAFLSGACIACHTVQGTAAAGKIGPDLTHLASRSFISGGVLTNTPDNLAVWLRDPQIVKPGNDMVLNPPLDEQVIRDLVTYLETLK